MSAATATTPVTLRPVVTVTQALAAVMSELPSIGKGEKSPQGYGYRGIEAITKHLQPLLAKHGVVISPQAEITDVRPSPAMKEGWQDVYMRVTWTVSGPDGSTLRCQTTGIGRDNSDKGANKAQTQAFKYLLLHLLCIADGKDDSDGASYEHARAVDRPLSQSQVAGFLARCAENGLDADDIAAVVHDATDERTSDPKAVLKSELDALRDALTAFTSSPSAGESAASSSAARGEGGADEPAQPAPPTPEGTLV